MSDPKYTGPLSNTVAEAAQGGASPAAPDVTLLLRAIERTPRFGRDRDYAERLAAEYARLTEQEERHG